jgi:hypothetical protein
MNRKNILLIALVLLLGSLCFYVYRDRFIPSPIQISHRFVQPRDVRRQRVQASEVDTVIFLFSRELRLASVRVIPLSEIKTSNNPHPIWELTSDSNSVPVKDLIYGRNIRGMRPAVKGAGAGPLQPGVEYRLMIKAGSHEAEHDFTPRPRTP